MTAAEALKEAYGNSELKRATEKTFKMTCISCGSNDWVNVDKYRIKPSGMHICNCCGLVSYPNKWQSYEDIKKHYRTDYRKPPTSNNLFTGQRKICFHQAFLAPLFEEWTKVGKNPKVFEIGAAYGMVLNWIKNVFPNSEVAGTELTTAYVRNAKQEYGIDLIEDFDTSKKYDLIVSYKVAEHQLDVDKELRKYAECLTDDGFLYISVPTWFDSMSNFGLHGFDLEYYYDTNHINVWTRKLFESMLKKAGLEIVKRDYIMYDSTYLCKRNDDLMKELPYYEDSFEIEERMKNIKEAFGLYNEGKYSEAIEKYPDYPTAHVTNSEMHRKEYFEKGWDWIKKNVIEKAINDCPTSVEVFIMATDLAMRANKFDEAIAYAQTSLKYKAENPPSLNHLILIMRELGLRQKDEAAKIHYFTQARNIARHLRDISTQHFKEATDMIYWYNAQIPD